MNQEPRPPEEKKSEGFNENLEKMKSQFQNYFNQGSRDLIAYALLIIGIILLFFHPFYGGFLIGLVVGAYFSKEILYLCKNFRTFVDEQGLVRSLIIGALLLAFLILAPAIFIGAAFVVLLKFFLATNE